jgi:flagellar motor switch protein FliG
MNRLEKVAVLLVSLGDDLAAELLRQLSSQDVAKVTQVMSRLGRVSEEAVATIQKEFCEALLSYRAPITGDGVKAQRILAKAFGSEEGARIHAVSPGLVPPVFAEAEDVSAKAIVSVLLRELPQTVSLILAHLSARKAGEIIALMPSNVRSEVLLRLASLGEVEQDVLIDVAEAFEKSLQAIRHRSSSSVGGMQKTAAILAQLAPKDRDEILAKMAEKDTALPEQLRGQMWTFLDLAKLRPKDFEILISKVEPRDIEIALRRCPDAIKQKFFAAMSKGRRESVEESLATSKPVPATDVERSQGRIAQKAQDLIKEGVLSDPAESYV